MSPPPVVVVLTDGEANLAHYMDLLRQQGYRVLATSRPYEAVLFIARNPETALLARAALLPDPSGDFLRQIRDLQPHPFLMVAAPPDEVPEKPSPLVDLYLTEPFRYSSLLEALEYAAERSSNFGSGRTPQPTVLGVTQSLSGPVNVPESELSSSTGSDDDEDDEECTQGHCCPHEPETTEVAACEPGSLRDTPALALASNASPATPGKLASQASSELPSESEPNVPSSGVAPSLLSSSAAPLDSPPEKAPAPAAVPSAATHRLLAYARRLTELERDREQLLTTGLEMFLELVEGERGSIMLRTEDGERLEIARRIGFPPSSETPRPIRIGESYAGDVAQTGKPLLVDRAQNPTRPEYASQSFLIVPLMDQKTVLGVVNLTDRRGGERFRELHLESTMALAHQFTANLVNSAKVEDLHRMAVIDPLTGLFNRRFFDRQIAIELERARRYERQLTLALLDIDNFKVINDLNGYTTGDMVIKSVAQVIRQSFREVDIVTRWGGDEFAVLLPETGKPRTARPGEPLSANFVERVRRTVEEDDFRSVVPNLTGRITVSAGVATYPVDAQDKDGLFLSANQALQRAKRTGHNRVCVAGDDGSSNSPITRSAFA